MGDYRLLRSVVADAGVKWQQVNQGVFALLQRSFINPLALLDRGP